MSQTIEDLQSRLQISLKSKSEIESEYQEKFNQLNSQRISDTISLKTNFSKKENRQNETIANLQEQNRQLQEELIKCKQQIKTLEKQQNKESEPKKAEINQIPIQTPQPQNKESKWKKRYKIEKEKKKEIKDIQIKQQKIIEENANKIEKLQNEIEEKQKTIESLQKNQTDSSIEIQSYKKEISDFKRLNSTISEENKNAKSLLNEQNEIQNRKIDSLTKKLAKTIQIINQMKEENEKLNFVNIEFKDKIKAVSTENEELNNILSEKDLLIQKILKKIKKIQLKNKSLKKDYSELKQSQSQSESTQNDDSIIASKFFSVIDSHKSELNEIINSNSNTSIIPLNLLPPELTSNLSGNELNIENIIRWYNNSIKSLQINLNQFKIMKNVISSCFTNVQFDFGNNKLFCEQVRNEINRLKDQLREMKLKNQQMHVNSLADFDKENT